jgi:hypothetical protein
MARRKQVEAQFAQLAQAMRAAVQLGAQYERSNHTYQNRTGNLERSTKGKLVRVDRRAIRAELVMGMPYASYVVRRGFSTINSTSVRVRDSIRDQIARIFR